VSELRDYQNRAVRDVSSLWARRILRPLCVMPTGAGKTRVAIDLTIRLFKISPNMKVLFLCPWRQLVIQCADRFREFGLEADAVVGGRKAKGAPICVATVQSAIRRKLETPDLIIVDEAHRAPARQCRTLLRRYPTAKVLGLTATPIRLDGKALGSVFDTIVEPISMQELINRRFLVPFKGYGPPRHVDLSGVRRSKKTKDYSSRGLSKAMTRGAVVGDAVSQWKRLARGRPTWTYCCSVAHAEAVTQAYNDAGIPCAIMTGKTGLRKRAEIFEDLLAGKLKVVANVAVLLEGIDCPPVSAVQCLRPTLSECLWRQMVGRGARGGVPGKTDCLILDHAGNLARHGFPHTPRAWSLDGKGSTDDPLGKEISKVTECPACGVLHPVGESHCSSCGFAWLPVVLPGQLEPIRMTR